jgi:hypothetical protein
MLVIGSLPKEGKMTTVAVLFYKLKDKNTMSQ